jgi:hypothetical protein
MMSPPLCGRPVFFEKTLNIGQARKQLKNAACHFSALAKCDPVFELFSEELYSFTEWAGANLFAQRQLAAAHNAWPPATTCDQPP